jgi:syntaxin 18
MDLTALFKACVKTVRLKRKNLPIPEPADKNRILKKSSKDDFNKRTKNIVYQITQLKSFLIEHSIAYMQFAGHLKSYSQTMTNEERDFIDIESEKIIDICTKLISDFKDEYGKKRTKPQETEHINSVFELLTSYLKVVYNIYHTQKHYRIQREIETYKYLKLDSDRKVKDIILHLKAPKNQEVTDDNDEALIENNVSSDKQAQQQSLPLDDDISESKFNYEDELSAEDLQIFESENVEIYKNLKGLSEEVEQIERNVVDIAKLQEIFTEKVRKSRSVGNTMVNYLLLCEDLCLIPFFLTVTGYKSKIRHRKDS